MDLFRSWVKGPQKEKEKKKTTPNSLVNWIPLFSKKTSYAEPPFSPLIMYLSIQHFYHWSCLGIPEVSLFVSTKLNLLCPSKPRGSCPKSLGPEAFFGWLFSNSYRVRHLFMFVDRYFLCKVCCLLSHFLSINMKQPSTTNFLKITTLSSITL